MIENIELLKQTFEQYSSEDHTFEKVEPKLSKRRDLHAFMLLDQIMPCPGYNVMISDAQHDVIYLNVDVEKLASVITHDQVLQLVRCGVFYDNQYESLSMFT